MSSTLRALHQVATHLMARARLEDAGRFSLRITPGGFGTPDLAGGVRRVRVAGELLLVELDPREGAALRVAPLHGSTLRSLAELAGVDLSQPLSVGHDTPALQDPDRPLDIDADEARAIGQWFAIAQAALDRLGAQLPADASPTLARLWPEHFDVAMEAVASPGQRINLGASPGDGFSAEPYLYAGPWTSARPGGGTYWNASFGAIRPRSQLSGDLTDAMLAFWREGVDRLASAPE